MVVWRGFIVHKNGTIVGRGCDNKVKDDDSGKLQPQNAHYKGVSSSDNRSFLPKKMMIK